MIAFNGVGVVCWAKMCVGCGDVSVGAWVWGRGDVSVHVGTGLDHQRLGAQVTVRTLQVTATGGLNLPVCIVYEAMQPDPFLDRCVCST
jgi:hypothetical protein